MQNIEAARQGDKLILTIDLSKKFGKSRSGKTDIIATTSGNVRVADTGERVVKMGINVYEVEEKERARRKTPKNRIRNHAVCGSTRCSHQLTIP